MRFIEKEKSKTQSAVVAKWLIAAREVGKSSDCIFIQPIPPVDQSDLINVGFELTYRIRRREIIILFYNHDIAEW